MQDVPINPEDLKRLHYWSGLALLTAQHLEYGFKYLLWMLAERGIIAFDPESATDLMENRAKLTLGQLLKTLGEHVTITDEVAEPFKKALDARNRFIHGFLVDRTDEIADPLKRNGVIREIKEIRATMLDGQEIIQNGIRQLIRLYGVELDDLQRQLHDEIRALNAGE